MIHERELHLRRIVEGIAFSHLNPDCYSQIIPKYLKKSPKLFLIILIISIY